MLMLVKLTNIINLRIRDRLIMFEERSSMKSINVFIFLNQSSTQIPFNFSFISLYPSLCGFTHRCKDQEFNKLAKSMLHKMCRYRTPTCCRSLARAPLLLLCPSCNPSLNSYYTSSQEVGSPFECFSYIPI
jgi:hypothetical protein